jgi:pyridoxamine 5'-phosphate oxidase
MEPNRYSYKFGVLEESQAPEDPFELIKIWLQDAVDHGVVEPYAMCVSTVSAQGAPSSRFVLLRDIDHGLVFFTNYHSRKGVEIESNPQSCFNFWWGPLERQVRIEGSLEKVSAETSDAYFNSRPHDSKAASAASPQSQIIDSRKVVEDRMAELLSQSEVQRPEHWGGYRLIPVAFEFWQGREARLHDRLRYERTESGWSRARLAP